MLCILIPVLGIICKEITPTQRWLLYHINCIQFKVKWLLHSQVYLEMLYPVFLHYYLQFIQKTLSKSNTKCWKKLILKIQSYIDVKLENILIITIHIILQLSFVDSDKNSDMIRKIAKLNDIESYLVSIFLKHVKITLTSHPCNIIFLS